MKPNTVVCPIACFCNDFHSRILQEPATGRNLSELELPFLRETSPLSAVPVASLLCC